MQRPVAKAMKGTARLGACTLAGMLGVGLAASGCQADPEPPASATTGGTGANGGNAGATAAGGDGEGPGVAPTETCTSVPPVAPNPDLNGRWGLRTIATRFAPATGLTPAFRTRTISVLLVDQSQTGAEVEVDARYCAQHAEDPDAPAHVVIPESYARSLAPFVRTGTYAENTAGTTLLRLPSFVEVVGAELDDPAGAPLPTDADDPTVFDQDGDGLPGVTIKLSGLVSGDLYVVQRQTSELVGLAVDVDRLEGRYEFTTEQNVLESDPATLKLLAAQTAVADPEPCASTFVMVRLPATASCDELLADLTRFD